MVFKIKRIIWNSGYAMERFRCYSFRVHSQKKELTSDRIEQEIYCHFKTSNVRRQVSFHFDRICHGSDVYRVSKYIDKAQGIGIVER